MGAPETSTPYGFGNLDIQMYFDLTIAAPNGQEIMCQTFPLRQLTLLESIGHLGSHTRGNNPRLRKGLLMMMGARRHVNT